MPYICYLIFAKLSSDPNKACRHSSHIFLSLAASLKIYMQSHRPGTGITAGISRHDVEWYKKQKTAGI